MRIRTVKPDFWSNEKMAALPDFTRLLAIALLNYADDEGYFWANPIMIRGAIFPFVDDSTKIRRGLDELSSEGFLRLGETSDGRIVGHIIQFLKHQRLDRPKPSEIKDLSSFDDQSTKTRRSIDEDSTLDRKGMEGNREGNGTLEPPAASRARNPLLDCLVEVAELTNPMTAQKTLWAKAAKALQIIKTSTPSVTPEEIRRRAANYALHFRGVSISSTALAAHWGRCDQPPQGNGSNPKPPAFG